MLSNGFLVLKIFTQSTASKYVNWVIVVYYYISDILIYQIFQV